MAAKKKSIPAYPVPPKNGVASVVPYGSGLVAVYRQGVQFFHLAQTSGRTSEEREHVKFTAEMFNKALANRSKPRECGCAERANKAIADQGFELVLSFRTVSAEKGKARRIVARTVVETTRIFGGRSRKKKRTLIASHCPFCGVEYPEPMERG